MRSYKQFFRYYYSKALHGNACKAFCVINYRVRHESTDEVFHGAEAHEGRDDAESSLKMKKPAA